MEEQVSIVDARNVRALASSAPADPSSIQIRLETGELLFVPRALVKQTADGALRFQHSFAEFLARVAGGEVVLPILEEHVAVTKRSSAREHVRLTTSVTSREERVDVPLRKEEVNVERVPVGRVVERVQAPHEEGNTLVVPVYEEVLVVEKRLLLREEIRVTRSVREEHERQNVTLRREHVTVERAPDAER